ncbi:major facilitator superfamily transporter [Colletotrichum falcatum]|nr:major facilitator superfamily transporter [Colletotrichum falcatum]
MSSSRQSSGSYELHGCSTEESPQSSGIQSPDKDASTTQSGSGDWEQDVDESQYPSGLQFTLIIFTLFVSVFIVAVSQTVLATAMPTITSTFGSFDDIAWYSTGEQITAVAMQLPFGRAYTLANNKWTFLASVVIYLIGSAIGGFAPVSAVLVVGRVIQGVGMAGVFGGSFIFLAHVTPLRKRSLFAGLFGAAYGIASVIGPIIGGAITTRASWRWCFWFNLPIGAVVIPTIVFCLPSSLGRTSVTLKHTSWKQTIMRFDPMGTCLLLASLVCLMLALQWGGGEVAWSDGSVIAAFVVFAATTLPIVSHRSVAGSSLYLLFLNGAFGVFIFFLPVWFQSINGDSAQTSGFKQIALCVGTALSSVVAGGLVVVIGFYNPFIILGSMLVTAGSALCMAINPDTSLGMMIGAQILVVTGVGAGAEQANVAVQAVLPSEKVAKGTSLTLFTRLLGIALSVPVAQSVVQQELVKALGSSLASAVYRKEGVTDLRAKLRAMLGDNTPGYDDALNGTNYAITRTFMLGLILASISLPFGLIVEWKDIRQKTRAG